MFNLVIVCLFFEVVISTYGLVGDKINMDEYGSIGFGPSGTSSSSSFLASSFFLFWNITGPWYYTFTIIISSTMFPLLSKYRTLALLDFSKTTEDCYTKFVNGFIYKMIL